MKARFPLDWIRGWALQLFFGLLQLRLASPHHARWNTDRSRAGRDVAHYRGACADYDVVANFDVLDHAGTNSDVRTCADAHSTREVRPGRNMQSPSPDPV